METDRSRRVFELFERACGLPADERDAFLAEACGTDRKLLAEIEALLKCDRRPSPILRGLEEMLQSPATSLPERVGRYRVLEMVGQGGMGVVYRAEQQNPRRIVAVKVLRSALATPSIARRFTTEAQILARLQHPGIAQILEAGVEDSDAVTRPFFAMEFIDGQTLLRYVESSGLDVRSRLHLFVQICEGVQHAHQRGVIHRDLKPDNILVDASGQAKILDFGVARLVDADESRVTQTLQGQVLGTLQYMSPEQLQGEAGSVDTRTDIYTLGVILYELLAGRPPHDPPSGDLVVSRILHQDVPLLGRLDPRFRGDLETIAATCMEWDRDRRYSSVSELAADVQRHLGYRPITARPHSALYQLQKFTRRHRGLVVGVGIAFLAVVAGTAATARYAFLASEAANESKANASAERDQRLRAEDLNRFLTDIFKEIDPDVAQGRDVRVLELLDPAARRIETEFGDSPLSEADLRVTLGRTYLLLRFPDLARPHLQTALRLREQQEENRDSRGEAMILLGQCMLAQAQYDRADDIFQRLETLATREPVNADMVISAVKGRADVARQRYSYSAAFERYAALELLLGQSEDMATVHLNRGSMYRELGEWQSARESLERAEAILVESGRERSYMRARVLEALSRLARDEGDWRASLKNAHRCADLYEELLGSEHVLTLKALSQRALYVVAFGDEVPEDLERRLKTARSTLIGLRTYPVAFVWNNLGLIAALQGRLEEAETLLLRALAVFGEVVGRTALDTASALQNLAEVRTRQSRYAEAEADFRKALEQKRQIVGDSTPANRMALHGLAWVLAMQGNFDEAEPLCRKALQLAMESQPDPTGSDVAWERSLLGFILAGMGQREEGVELIRDARETLRETLGEFHLRTLYCTHHLAHSLAAQRAFDEAEELFLLLADEYSLERAAGPTMAAGALNELGEMLYHKGDMEAALEIFEQALQMQRSAPEIDSIGIVLVLNNTGSCHLRLQRWEDAEVVLQEAVAFARDSLPPMHKGRLDSLQNHATALEHLDRFSDGIEVWKEVLEIVSAQGAADGPRAQEALRNLIQLNEWTGQSEEVIRWRARLAGK